MYEHIVRLRTLYIMTRAVGAIVVLATDDDYIMYCYFGCWI